MALFIAAVAALVVRIDRLMAGRDSAGLASAAGSVADGSTDVHGGPLRVGPGSASEGGDRS
jgi:hypothetical protein